MTDETYFDVRFRYSGIDTDQVALNWQRGLSAAHSVPIDTLMGTWGITGVRPHQRCKRAQSRFRFGFDSPYGDSVTALVLHARARPRGSIHMSLCEADPLI